MNDNDKFLWPEPDDDPLLDSDGTNADLRKHFHLDWSGGTEASYRGGYWRAIRILLDEIAVGDDPTHPDTLFYPVAFLCRHYIELSLKSVVTQGRLVFPNLSDYKRNHKLGALWELALPVWESLWPDADRSTLDAVEAVIRAFVNLDQRGTDTRYATELSGEPHNLPNAPRIIDHKNMLTVMTKLHHFFEGCHAAIEEIQESQQDQG